MIIALLLASSSPFASQRLDNPTSTIVSNRPHPGTFLLTLACLLLCVRQDSPEQDRWRFKGLRCSILLEQLALHRPITASHFAWHSECITHCSCTSAANRPRRCGLHRRLTLERNEHRYVRARLAYGRGHLSAKCVVPMLK